ncbi:MAG TPA: enoyl-CoA hydratase/isomerase family protein [bacterium]|nr:enoyl-CoA hydratase/isomerase family protein [bacterium]
MTDKDKIRSHESFDYENLGSIAVFTFKGKSLFHAAGLHDMEFLDKAFKDCADSKDLKIIIVKRDREKKDLAEYAEFIKYAAGAKDKMAVNKMLNYYSRFILEVYSQNKFVISVDSGNVVATFLNLSLACDYRIISDDTVIQKAYFPNGTIPKGGATFLISQLLGKGKAYEILLSGEDIAAQQALELGLVNEVVPKEDLESATMKRAEYFAQIPKYTIGGIKRMMNYPHFEALKKYLEQENEVILRIFEKLDFDGPSRSI